MLRQLQNTVRKHGLFSPGQHVLVAVSGGADSVALLWMLWEQRQELGIRLTVAHLNHGIRGRSAADDAQFVRQLARRLRVPVVIGHARVPALARKEGISLEMAARRARYDFLVRAAARVRATVVATAHTADDQAETVLLKLVRGAGPKGLAGISYKATRQGVRIVRPMLDLTRTEIVAFLRERGEAWREDETNEDESFQRNRVRHRILPILEKELNPKVRAALRRTADILREEDRWLDAVAASRLAKCRTRTGTLDLMRLRKQDLALRRRIFRLWLVAAGVPAERVDFDTLDRLERLLAPATAGKTVPVAGPWVVERRYQALVIRRSNPTAANAYRKTLKIPGKTVVKEAGLSIITSLAPGLVKDREARLGTFPARASLCRTAAGSRKITVRSWRPGDRLRPLGMKGSKKIQDIAVDEKVPAAERQRLPLFECGGEIIWLPGYRVAQGWDVRRPSESSLQIMVDRCE